ncbi:hypothetical protein BVC93_11420 [Mycobacterium sp. MS1601]|uniref:hypothetical protein n=1 Tax=Mycobacterium sp. MS1601 TaxID=1936029 RepID=UPI0009794A18|nr:hypothetical protein [Mycobacterium sp. MS1601]AQA02941.1 hypothetical protein BVC93_11420 [Mycobacterium sp. MS1601]
MAQEIPVGDRHLIEDALNRLRAGAPPAWTALHAEFGPAVPHGWAVTAASEPIAVNADVAGLMAEHFRRATAAGAPYSRIILDCRADGTLLVRAEPPATNPDGGGKRHAVRLILAGVTLACLAVSGVLFVKDWRWSPLPEADLVTVPATPPRQAEALKLVTRWHEAERRGDIAAMRTLVCARPGNGLSRWMRHLDGGGEQERLAFPEGIVDFSDTASGYRARVVYAARPLNEEWSRAVDDVQGTGGLFIEDMTLTDENGLKLCDIEVEVRPR